MASYTITTNSQQEEGLTFSYDTYANKAQFPTQQSWFQYSIDLQVSNNMYAQKQAAMSRSFDESFNTIPEPQKPTARTEIENVITNHGGSIIQPGSGVTGNLAL